MYKGKKIHLFPFRCTNAWNLPIFRYRNSEKLSNFDEILILAVTMVTNIWHPINSYFWSLCSNAYSCMEYYQNPFFEVCHHFWNIFYFYCILFLRYYWDSTVENQLFHHSLFSSLISTLTCILSCYTEKTMKKYLSYSK